MESEEDIHIYIDESGNLTNSDTIGSYGFGWVTMLGCDVKKVEAKLKSSGLDNIHMYTLDIPGKRAIAQKLASSRIENLKIAGGALIRKDHKFTTKIVANNFLKQALSNPKKFVADFGGHLAGDDRLVLSPIEMVPKKVKSKIRSTIRIKEVANLATRYPIFGALQQFGLRRIIIHWSAIGTADRHRRAIGSSLRSACTGLNELISQFIDTGRITIKGPIEPTEIILSTEEKNNEVFGLADYFAWVGQAIASDNESKRALGLELHKETRHLFMSSLDVPTIEVVPGVFVRNEMDGNNV